MRKERNCGMPYPIYNQPMNPQMMNNGMMPMNPQMMNSGMMPQSAPYYTTSNTIEQQLNTMQEQINSLENRVSKLEMGKTGSNINNKYNDSNYYML